MQLDRLALHLRRRGPWEAIDLGCAMARTWWPPLIAAWLAVYLPAALVLGAIFHEWPFVALLILWWLKPAFDRVLLEVLSRAVFGDVPRAREAVRALARAPGLLASLTIYRFDLARSFNLPIWQLEKLKGSAARKRGQSLQRRSRRYAVWLTVVCVHFEVVMLVGFFGAVDLFTPAHVDNTFGLGSYFRADAPLWRQYLDVAVHVLAVGIVEPFYVAGGFALYLNRRTELEAWDVELALRRFASRVPLREGLAAAVLALVWLSAAAPQPSLAASMSEQHWPQSVIREVLATPEFEREREVTRLRYKGRGTNADDNSASTSTFSFSSYLAEFARALMWLVVIALVAALVHLARRYSGVWMPERAARQPTPDVLFGLDITPASLPDDIVAAALAALDKGDSRGALGLLYRGALSALVNREGIDFAPGDTEGDCVRRTGGHVAPAKSDFMRTLVAAWQATAYGGRSAPADSVRALCAGWKQHFEKAPET